MKRAGYYCFLFLLLICLVGGILTACKGNANTSSTATSAKPDGDSTTVATTGVDQTTATASSTTSLGRIPEIASMKTLSSYRYSIMTKVLEGEGAGSVDYMKYEWVRDQKAEHAWMEDNSGNITETYITIGEKTWIWFPMIGWVEQEAPPTTETTIASDLADQLMKAQQDMENSKMRFEKTGTEVVNNVNCIKYEYDYYLTIETPNMGTGGTIKTEMHSKGSMWIADDKNLAAVLIRSTSTTEMIIGVEKTVLESDQNLTDIGAAIDISAPDSAMTIPTSSTTATGSTTAANPSTGTLLFTDNFQSAWDSRWEWLDPNNDAAYGFTAHAGFLRLTVPQDNDLAGVANYDAPRLLMQQNGDFALETLIEFDPREYYQGAGLLVWQDADTFLRLEFGFGGMGGEDKNVVFVKQEEGNLDFVGSIDLPESTKSIELRLRRHGDEHTAWYRLNGGAWQMIGSCEIDLMDTVQVGIVQVTQYTTSEISADFDYFKVFSE